MILDSSTRTSVQDPAGQRLRPHLLPSLCLRASPRWRCLCSPLRELQGARGSQPAHRSPLHSAAGPQDPCRDVSPGLGDPGGTDGGQLGQQHSLLGCDMVAGEASPQYEAAAGDSGGGAAIGGPASSGGSAGGNQRQASLPDGVLQAGMFGPAQSDEVGNGSTRIAKCALEIAAAR